MRVAHPEWLAQIALLLGLVCAVLGALVIASVRPWSSITQIAVVSNDTSRPT